MRLLSYNNSELVVKFVLKVKYTMRKSFTYFLLICSLILVLGHSFLPHSHIEGKKDMCEISASRDLTIAEIIKISLAHNLGSNHLEEYNPCKPLHITSIEFNWSLLRHEVLMIPAVSFSVTNENSGFTNANPIKQHFPLITSLRAPPLQA